MKMVWNAECNDNNDWIKRCTVLEVECNRQRRRPRKSQRDGVR